MTEKTKNKPVAGYPVGYGKPPVSTRFKPGQSGNPHGRPRGTLNVATVLANELRQRVVINENGQRTTVTKLEAALKQIANKSAAGDLTAARFLLMLEGKIEETLQAGATAKTSLADADQRVIDALLKGFETNLNDGKEGHNENNEEGEEEDS